MEDEELGWLEDIGILEWSGMDSDGNRSFSINHENLMSMYPSVYEGLSKEFYRTLDLLNHMGYLKVRVVEDRIQYYITKKGIKLINNYKKGMDSNDSVG